MSYALSRKVVEKVWGRKTLPPEFGPMSREPVGEIWFEPCNESSNLLVKYLFTSDKLSVQVHPSERHAEEMGLGHRGKEECWLVLEAKPGAAVALGLDKKYDPETVRRAAADGSIEDMLVWHKAREGDFFHVPPGTIHAIGPGLTLLEIQQNSEITFRFFDYGRPRELHLDQALACAHLEPYPVAERMTIGEQPEETLLDSPAFSVRMLRNRHSFVAAEPTLVVPLSGQVEVSCDVLGVGSCWVMETGDVLRSRDDAEFVIVQDNRGRDGHRDAEITSIASSAGGVLIQDGEV